MTEGGRSDKRDRRLEFFIAILGVFLAAAALYASMEQSQIAVRALNDQRLSAAWQTLAIAGGGSTGKVYSINTLAEHGESLHGIDLSCERDGRPKIRFLQRPQSLCSRPVDLTGIKLESTRPIVISRSTFAGAEINDFFFDGTTFEDAVFDDAVLFSGTAVDTSWTNVSFEESQIAQVQFRGGAIGNVSFENATINRLRFSDVNMFSVDFTGANLSSTHIEGGTLQYINISRVRFCGNPPRETDPPFVESEMATKVFPAEGGPPRPLREYEMSDCAILPPEFWQAAYFFADTPPVDVHLFGDYLDVREGCQRAKDDPSVPDLRGCAFVKAGSVGRRDPVSLTDDIGS